jgi:hypothetical protein
MKGIILCVVLLFAGRIYAQNEPPVITSVKCTIDSGRKNVRISYRVTDKQERVVKVRFTTGKRSISWDYGNAVTDISRLRFKIVADDGVAVDAAEILRQVDTSSMRERLGMIADLRLSKGKDMNSRMTGLQQIMQESWKQHYAVEQQDFKFGAYTGRNVIAKKIGIGNKNDALVLCASYDFTEGSPGANSNGSGLAGLMEIADILSAYTFVHSIIIIGFDYSGEEFIGSNEYVFHNGIQPYEHLKGVLNLDRIGSYSDQPNSHMVQEAAVTLFPEMYGKILADSSRANFLTVVSNTDSHELGETFRQTAAKYVPELTVHIKEFPGYGELNVNGTEFVQFSDHITFWYRKYPALWITDGGAGKRTNGTMDDKPGGVNTRFWSNAVKASLATLITLSGPAHCSVYQSSFIQ